MNTIKGKLIFGVTSLSLLCILACRKPRDTPGRVISTFNENFRIRMNETVDSVKRTLTFRCYTEKIYLCSNYWIEATSNVINDKITINFIRIWEPEACLTSLGPAMTELHFDQLSNKNYEIVFNFSGFKITGRFDVTSQSFVATLPQQSRVQFLNPDLKRVPDNTIYGTVHYHQSTTNTIVQKYIDSLQFYGATTSLYPPGDYFRFQIDSTGRIKQTQDLGYYFTRYYIFNYSGNSSPLKDLVQRFGLAYPDDLIITLNTTKGEVFYSWKH
jgi:hypothetical protein